MSMVKLTVPSEYYYSEVMDLLARFIAHDAGLSEERIIDLEYCLHEIFVNAIEHGYEDEEGDDIIEITFIVDDESVSVEIQDFGKGAPLKAFEPFSPLKKKRRNEAGGGLRLARQFVDELSVESTVGQGTTVKVKMLLNKEEKENGHNQME